MEIIDNRIKNIEDIVLEHLSLCLRDILNKSQQQEYVNARFIIWYFIREFYPNKFGLKYQAGLYCRESHADVKYGARKVSEWMVGDKLFKKNIEEIKELIEMELK